MTYDAGDFVFEFPLLGCFVERFSNLTSSNFPLWIKRRSGFATTRPKLWQWCKSVSQESLSVVSEESA